MPWLLAFAVLGVIAPPNAPTATAGTPPSSASAVAPAGFPATPTDAATLLRALATVQGLEARFTERKHLALLRAPLESTGTLYYTRPGHMVRVVDSPSPSTVRIGPRSLELTRREGTQHIDLRRRPDIKMFVESFVHVVAGHHAQLAATYTLEFTPAPSTTQPWRLTLTPRQQPLSTLIERLEISGQGYEVTTIKVLERQGDSTEITMSAVDPRRHFSEQERERIFGLPPAS